MDIVNLLAGTGAKAPLTGKSTGNAEPGAPFASILDNATNVHGTTSAHGLTLLATSDLRATATANGAAGQALHAKLDAANLLASKDIEAAGKNAPQAGPEDAQASQAKDAQKTGKKTAADDKGKHAKNTALATPDAPVAAAIGAALAAIAGQPEQNASGGSATVGNSHAIDAKPGKLAETDARGDGSRHQLQQLQQTARTVTSSATSSHTDSDAGGSNGGQGFASQLLLAANASTHTAAPAQVDNGAASSALNGLLNTNPVPQVTHATAPATVYSATLQAPVGSTPWQNELGQELIRFSQRGEHQIELHLHPQELGPLQITLHVNDQVAQAHFFAAHAQVREAVQQAIPQLREALAGQGIALGEAMVGQQQQQRQDSSSFAGSPSSPFDGTTEIESVASVRPAANLLPLAGGSGVDLYA